MNKQSIVILGSTGSIGVSTLDVMARHPERFDVYALVAGSNIDLLFQQVITHRPKKILIANAQARNKWLQGAYAERVKNQAGLQPELLGQGDLAALCQSAEVDSVMAAIVGAAGLEPTLAALEAGKTVFLANKESLVLAGRFMLDACKKSGARILPVDSEHNAIYQCLPSNYSSTDPHTHGIERIILTASGGPFRTSPLEDLLSVTPEQAVAHPNWSMGKKISVDSASMANKGLELIEALWLFGLPAAQLSVLIHPQSIVHSMVEYKDGSVLAQLGCPDMRTPIAHVLGLPDRIESGSPRLNLAQIVQLNFEEPDLARFPMLKLAYEALNAPSTLAPIYNAANEVAVELFLNRQIGFMNIYSLVNLCMNKFSSRTIQGLDGLFDFDTEVRQFALQNAAHV
ncbi:MAG: 1-deoxy-D-xylulose-5-phosphate reductoisomerase [Limnobacter sp.]|nr:1-deoxy-D-xylulose-5-phosphate reductoisomerase [Limnobacter sp.]